MSVSHVDVDRWFREAWQGKSRYPDEGACRYVVTRLNIMRPRRDPSRREFRKRAKAFVRLAHELQVDLALGLNGEAVEAVRQAALSVETVATRAGLTSPVVWIADAAREAWARTACRAPPPLDMVDPKTWMTDFTPNAWARVTDAEKKKGVIPLIPAATGNGPRVPLGRKENSPLVVFVGLALEAIGPASGGAVDYDLATISDHLRRPQDRSRRVK